MGVGMVSRANGTAVRPMEYSLTVYQRFHEGGIPGLFRIEGCVRVELHEGLSLVGDELTLALEDGRALDFFLKDSGRSIANRSNRFKANAPPP